MGVKGGQKLARFVKQVQRQARKTSGVTTEIGFHDPRIARLAATHEFGLRDAEGKRKLPAWPAFGRSLMDLRREYRDELRKQARGSLGLVTLPRNLRGRC